MAKYKNIYRKASDLVVAGIDKCFSFKSDLKAEHEKLARALIARKLRELTSAMAKEKKITLKYAVNLRATEKNM